jgi:hypothetical protein
LCTAPAMSESTSFELFMVHAGPGEDRHSFGLAPTLDDVPAEVMDTNGDTWIQVYIDHVDRLAIYMKGASK